MCLLLGFSYKLKSSKQTIKSLVIAKVKKLRLKKLSTYNNSLSLKNYVKMTKIENKTNKLMKWKLKNLGVIKFINSQKRIKMEFKSLVRQIEHNHIQS